MILRTPIGASSRNCCLAANGDSTKMTWTPSSRMTTTDKIPRSTMLSPMIPITETISSKVAHQHFGMPFAYGARITYEQWLWRW